MVWSYEALNCFQEHQQSQCSTTFTPEWQKRDFSLHWFSSSTPTWWGSTQCLVKLLRTSVDLRLSLDLTLPLDHKACLDHPQFQVCKCCCFLFLHPQQLSLCLPEDFNTHLESSRESSRCRSYGWSQQFKKSVILFIPEQTNKQKISFQCQPPKHQKLWI